MCCELIDFSFGHLITTFKDVLNSLHDPFNSCCILFTQSIHHFRKDGSVKKLLARQNHYYLTKSYHFTGLVVQIIKLYQTFIDVMIMT